MLEISQVPSESEPGAQAWNQSICIGRALSSMSIGLAARTHGMRRLLFASDARVIYLQHIAARAGAALQLWHRPLCQYSGIGEPGHQFFFARGRACAWLVI
eukprot:4691413-Pyramimonas_sp.AAC.1